MGGKTLKDKRGKQLCSRLNKEDFMKVRDKIFEILNKYENFTFTEIQNFPEKDNFGDLDLLYIYDENKGDKEDNKNLEEIIRQNFNPTQYITTNIRHITFDFNCELVGIENTKFEIELIETNSDEIDFIKFILNYNDLGNILGKILNHYGFKLSRNDGLICELRHKTIDKTKSWDTILGDIFLSKNPEKICEFIGLDYNTYLGLSNCQSSNNIYDWLISSPIFDPNHFKNYIDKTRPFYNGFLEFIKNKFSIDTQYENTATKYNNIQLDSIGFFEKKEEYNTIAGKYIEEFNVKCERKKKFSGADVKQFVFNKNKKFENLPNDKIVKIINSFKTFCIQDKLKKNIFDEIWEKYVISTNIDEIRKKLDEWWKLYENDIKKL